jgi:hypothetical protein
MENDINSIEIKEKKEFFEWLNPLLKKGYKTDRFREAAWIELQDREANKYPFELESRFALLNRPYTYNYGGLYVKLNLERYDTEEEKILIRENYIKAILKADSEANYDRLTEESNEGLRDWWNKVKKPGQSIYQKNIQQQKKMQKQENKEIYDVPENHSYEYQQIDEAINRHLKNTPESPIKIKIGDSPDLNYKSSLLFNLNHLLNKYDNKLYNEDLSLCDLKSNPNITLSENNIYDVNNNNFNLNKLLSNTTLKLINELNSSFNNNPDKNYVIIYQKLNKKADTNISNFELYSLKDNIITEDDKYFFNLHEYQILNECHTIKKASKEFQYFSIINSFKDKPILNPSYKYNFNPNIDIFQSLPKDWKKYININNLNNNTERNNKQNKTKIISSSISRDNSR